MGIGGPGLGIGEPHGEELDGREASGLVAPREDDREGPFELIIRERDGGVRAEFPGAHRRYA